MTHFTDTPSTAIDAALAKLPEPATPLSLVSPLTTPADPKPPVSGGYKVSALQPVPDTVDPLLTTILSWPRAHDSKSEQKFCKWLRETILNLTGKASSISALGCIVASVDYATVPATPSTTLFSCHVDTIDPMEPPKDWGKKPFKKDIVYDTFAGEIFLAENSAGGSLGADDGVGVWLMLRMLEAKVPGTYVFHRGEERGGLGSKEMLLKQRKWLGEFEAAVAFDRGQDFEIITHQGSQRCASDKYATALAVQFKKYGMDYELSTRGSFTDTKVYRGVIPECINLGVGYQNQHGTDETLDYAHAFALKNALVQVNFDALPIDRDPTKADPVPSYTGYQGNYGGKWASGTGATSASLFGRDDDFDDCWGKDKIKAKTVKTTAPARSTDTTYDTLLGTSLADIEAWIEDNPADAASSMGLLMVEIAELRARARTLEALAGLDV